MFTWLRFWRKIPSMTPKPLPPEYDFLNHEDQPQIFKEALRWYGTIEFPGEANNPVIIEWAKEINGWIGEWYDQDSVPWCGLFMALCAKRAGFPFNQKALSAREWINWGNPVTIPARGDILVFQRSGGGHVGLYVAEDGECFHVLGGNQSDSVCITRIKKDRLVGARRCKWKISQPDSVRRTFLSNGVVNRLSTNEA